MAFTRSVSFAVAALALTGALLFAPAQASAQSTAIGGGLVFSDLDPFDLGLQVNGYVAVPAVAGLRAGGDVTYYLPQDDVNLLSLNLNAQYFIVDGAEFDIYGFGGLNISRWSSSNSFGDSSGNEMGLNIGAGLEYVVGFGNLFAEAKIVTGDLDRMGIAAGVRIPL